MNRSRLFLTLTFALIFAISLAAGAGCTKKESPAPQQPRTDKEEKGQMSYVGSSKCSTCHSDQYGGWEDSLHRLMLQDAKKAGVILGNFDKEGSPFEIAKDIKKEDIQYTIGSQWKQRYVIKQNNSFLILPAEWIVATKSWQPYHPDDWNTETRHYEGLCIACHSTGYNTKLGASINEAGIGCEACHGPGQDHIAGPSSTNIKNPANLSYEQQVEVCGQCHIRGAEVKGKREDALGFLPGGELAKYITPLKPTAEELKKEKPAFFPDGASKKHHQQYNDYIQSKHYAAKVATCSYCHNTHAGKGAQGEIPLTKPIDQLCEDCHKSGGIAAGVKLEKPYLDNYLPERAKSAVEADIRSHTFKPDQPKKAAPKAPYKE